MVLQPICLLKAGRRLAFIREAHHVVRGRLVFQFSRFDALELLFVRNGKRVIGYDNERGKGDHRHLGKKRMPCQFVDEAQLLADFWQDVTEAMKTNKAVLHLSVGEPMEASLARVTAAMKAANHGRRITPYFGAGFDDVGDEINRPAE